MRKFSLQFLPALLLLALGAPRPTDALSFGVGPKIGANFGNADIEGVDDEEMRTGLAVGGMAEFGVTSPFSLVLEPMYLQRGSRFDAFGSRARGDFNYFEVPVLGKAKFGSLSSAHAYLFLGPAFGLKTSSEGRFAGFSDDFEDQVASFNVSGDVGAGVAYRLRPYNYLSVDVRYSHGFTDALEEDVLTIESWHHRDVKVLVGFLIHLIE